MIITSFLGIAVIIAFIYSCDIEALSGSPSTSSLEALPGCITNLAIVSTKYQMQ